MVHVELRAHAGRPLAAGRFAVARSTPPPIQPGGPQVAYAPLDLTGKTAVVVGGTSGIGRAIALALAEAGADVAPTSRRQEQVDAAADEIEARGRRSLRVASDVVDRDSLVRFGDAAIGAFGHVDILVNSAGRNIRAPTLDFPESDWQEILAINLTGTLRTCQIFGRHMIERRQGRIINIASLTSFIALHEVAAYGASKAGVAALTRSLAVEWAPYNICVNGIAPGIIRTNFNAKLLDGTPRGQELLLRTPMKRFGRAEDVAGAAVFLASDAAGFVTGEILRVDGGMLASGVNQ
jgi:NAD(P)-dependent dehydrogenase (short-subunit alcohol dehydrogenase family)